MIRLLKPLANLSLLLALSGCVSYSVSDWQASITLPASQDCYSFSVLTGKESRQSYDDPQCMRRKRNAIWIDSASYKLLRGDIEKNCLASKCKQITGAFDELFLKLDRALQQIPQ